MDAASIVIITLGTILSMSIPGTLIFKEIKEEYFNKEKRNGN